MSWKNRAKEMNDNPEQYAQNDGEQPTWHSWKDKIPKGKPEIFLFHAKGTKIVQNGRAMGQHYLYGDVEYMTKDGEIVSECLLLPQKARSLLLGKSSTDADIPKLVGMKIILKDYGKQQNKWVDKVTGVEKTSREFRNVIAEEWKE